MPPGDGRDSEWLLRRWAKTREPALQEELVRRFRPLARKLALRYARAGEPLDDLEQVACLGLIKALKRFDPERGFAFTTYAVPTILGELRRNFRDTAWSAHVPRAIQERVAEVRKEIEAFTAVHGRTPTVAELAQGLEVDEERVLEAMSAAASLSSTSLDGMRGGGDDDEGDALVDRLGEDDPGYQLVEDRAAIESVLPILTDVQRHVLRLRFEEDLKQSEIAGRVGVSQMQVSRVLRSALATVATVANHRSGN